VGSLYLSLAKPKTYNLVPRATRTILKPERGLLFMRCCMQYPDSNPTQFSMREKDELRKIYMGYELKFSGLYWIGLVKIRCVRP